MGGVAVLYMYAAIEAIQVGRREGGAAVLYKYSAIEACCTIVGFGWNSLCREASLKHFFVSFCGNNGRMGARTEDQDENDLGPAIRKFICGFIDMEMWLFYMDSDN